MRIQFKMEGGIASFPGLSKPITIDSDQLPQQESDELKRLVNTTHFFDLPAVIGSPAPGAADYFSPPWRQLRKLAYRFTNNILLIGSKPSPPTACAGCKPGRAQPRRPSRDHSAGMA